MQSRLFAIAPLCGHARLRKDGVPLIAYLTSCDLNTKYAGNKIITFFLIGEEYKAIPYAATLLSNHPNFQKIGGG